MQWGKVKIGMMVKVNDLLDNETQNYRIDKISTDGFLVDLSYDCDGEQVSGGKMDITYLNKIKE